MIFINNFIDKSYYDLMIEIDKYNKIYNQNIHIIVCKINNNIKFNKCIPLKNYYYINLYTMDDEICKELNKILELPYENERIYNTYLYFLDLLYNIENSKKIIYFIYLSIIIFMENKTEV